MGPRLWSFSHIESGETNDRCEYCGEEWEVELKDKPRGRGHHVKTRLAGGASPAPTGEPVAITQ